MTSNLLNQNPLFADLTTEDCEALSDCFEDYHCSKGTVLLQARQTGRSLYLLTSGFVSLAATDGQQLATLGPGSVVGELALFHQTPSDVNVTAVSDLNARELSDNRLRELLFKRPAMALRLRRKLGRLPVQMNDYLLSRMQNAPALSELPIQVLQTLVQNMDLHELKAEEQILIAGKNPSGLFLLDSGEIALRNPGRQAGIQHTRRVRQGELMGTLPLLTQRPSTIDGIAVQDCLVWLLPAQEFHSLISQHPVMRRVLARNHTVPLSPSEQNAAQSLLAKLPYFATLPPEMLRRISAVMSLQYVAAGERVYTAGQSCDAFYVIAEGEVAFSAQSIGGSIKEFERLGTNACFGERGLLMGEAHREDAATLCHTTLWVLSRANLNELCNQHPDVAAAIHQQTADYLSNDKPDRTIGALRQVALFADLSEQELIHISTCLQAQTVEAGSQIYAVASPGEALYLLQSGQVRIQPPVGPSRKVSSGEAFGIRALLHNTPHDANAVAETTSDLWILRQRDFADLMTLYPSMASTLTRLLSQRLALMADMPSANREAETDWATLNHSIHADQSPSFASVWMTLRDWFADQTMLGKLRTGLVAFIVVWGLGFGFLSARQSLRGNAIASTATMDVRSAIQAVQSMGSWELARQDKQLAQALALADRMAPPTPVPTLPPTVTPTPLPTATPTSTPRPTATPTATNPPPVVVSQVVQEVAAPPPPEPELQAALASRTWDARLDQLGVVIEEPDVPSGQPYWRLVEAVWQDEQESAGKHHIYVEVLDENGNRIVGQPVTAYWADGSFTAATEDKQPPDYAFNYQMYATGNAYHVKVEGLASDIVHGIGMGSLELPRWSIHTSFMLTFQRTIKP